MKLAHIIAIALILSLSGCATLAPGYVYKTSELNSFTSSWQALAALAVFISILFVSIGYMIAHLTADEPFKAKVKAEFAQVFYSGLIIIFTVALFASVDTIAKSTALIGMDAGWTAQVNALCVSPSDPAYRGPCHIAIARNYLDVLFNTAKEANLRVAMINSMVAWLSSMSLDFSALIDPSPKFVFQPFAGMSVMSETLGIIFETMIKLMMFIKFQQFFLDLIYTSIFPIFLFSGVILRTFFFTRKLGGLMIAIALGLFITFPAMHAFTGYLMFKTTGGTYDALLFNVSYDPTQTAAIGQDSEFDQYDPAGTDKLKFGTCLSNEKYLFTSNQTMQGQIWPNYQNIEIYNKNKPSDKVIINTVAGSNANEFNFTDVKGDTYKLKKNTLASGKELYMLYAIYNGTSTTQFFPLEIINFMASNIKWYFQNDVSSSFNAMVAGDEVIGMGGLIDQTAMIMLFTLVMPFVSLMVTIASIKVASPLFGGDTEIAGLTRII